MLATTTCPSSPETKADIRLELGVLEDRIAASGWAWDEGISLRVDALIMMLEERGA